MSDPPPLRSYHYFDVLVGLAWSDDLESYFGVSIATGQGLPGQM